MGRLRWTLLFHLLFAMGSIKCIGYSPLGLTTIVSFPCFSRYSPRSKRQQRLSEYRVRQAFGGRDGGSHLPWAAHEELSKRLAIADGRRPRPGIVAASCCARVRPSAPPEQKVPYSPEAPGKNPRCRRPKTGVLSGEMVGAPRFELGTSCSRSKRATRLRHAPMLSSVYTSAGSSAPARKGRKRMALARLRGFLGPAG